MDDIIKEFLIESNESLDQLDRDFVELEQDPTNTNLLSRIFRCVHTIKGTCGFFGFKKLESVTHVGENLLGLLRDGTLVLNSEIATALLSLVDAIRKMVGCIEQTGNDGDGDYSDLIATLTRLQKPGHVDSPKVESIAPELVKTEENKNDAPVTTEVKQVEPASPVVSQQTPNPVQSKVAEKDHTASVAEGAIRVDVGLLDRLMNLVGELVLSRNQIIQFVSTQLDSNLLSASQRLNLITSELQEGVMKTRMQPIGNVWSKYPRVVRDLAASCNKKVKLEMVGQETELDKTLLEAIKDPLTHIVRNSVDHGIESPEKRKAAGKPEEGTLTLKAFHEGGQVNIEIIDDGGGINPEKILEKAISKGLITQEQAAKMGEREALNLIFLPGFSTAEKVTNISGRGVGMDVVRTNIERINGVIDLQSKPGKGTTLKIKIPLTLAIIPALLVTCDGNRYAIPQANLVELVGLDAEKSKQAIEQFQGVPVYRLRGKLLPLIYLREVLGLPLDSSDRSSLQIVVLQADNQAFGLVVDLVNDTQEIVVKPLGKQLKNVDVYSGATIMGDGCVALILDVLNIAGCANLTGKSKEMMGDDTESAHHGFADQEALLIIKSPDDGRQGIPLSTVSRLEKFPKQSIEIVSGREVIQYRGKIMPLIRLSQIAFERRSATRRESAVAEKQTIQVVVYSRDTFTVGVVVDQIIDVVHEVIKLEKQASRPGVVGSMVIRNRVTEILNLEEIVKMAMLEEFDGDKESSESKISANLDGRE